MNRGILQGIRLPPVGYRALTDVDTQLGPEDRFCALTTTLTAQRTIRLASAASVPPNTTVTIADSGQSASGSFGGFSLLVTIQNVDYLQGGGFGFVSMSALSGRCQFISDGVATWHVVPSAPLTTSQGGTGQVTAAAAADALLGTTTRGDLPYRSTSAMAALAISGNSGKYLKAGANDPAWATIPTVATDVLWAAKGDLAVGTANDTASVLSVSSTEGHTQLVDSSAATGLVYGYPTPATSVYLAASGAISETVPRVVCGGTAVSLASGTLQMQAIFLPKNVTVTSISFRSTGAASTPTHWWFALLNSSRVYLRSTGDQTTTAWGATTTKTVNLSSTFVTTYEGLHYLGIMMTGTTPTTLPASTTTANIAGVAPILGGTSTTGLTTAQSDGVTAGAIVATAGQIYGWCS